MKDTALRLHGIYCELTGQVGLPVRFERERMWFDWMRCGWGEQELRTVIRYLRIGINEGKRNAGALKFSNLIGQPDRFEEDLFEARRVLRPARPRSVEVERRDAGVARRVEVPVADEVMDVGEFFKGIREEMRERNDQKNTNEAAVGHNRQN